MPRSSVIIGTPRRLVVLMAGVLLLGVGLLLFGAAPLHAQRSKGTVTLGLQIGQPGGVTGKIYRSPNTAYTGLITTNGDDFAALYLHRLHERPLPDSLLHLYVGPGLLVGLERLPETPSPLVGLSTQIGLNFYAERFEVFIMTTPTIRFLPNFTPTLGGSVGLRYTLGGS